jgi:hypothetical protein
MTDLTLRSNPTELVSVVTGPLHYVRFHCHVHAIAIQHRIANKVQYCRFVECKAPCYRTSSFAVNWDLKFWSIVDFVLPFRDCN